MTGATVTTVATVTTRQAAEILEVDPRTIRRMADRGALPAIRLTPTSPRRIKAADVFELAIGGQRS